MVCMCSLKISSLGYAVCRWKTGMCGMVARHCLAVGLFETGKQNLSAASRKSDLHCSEQAVSRERCK